MTLMTKTQMMNLVAQGRVHESFEHSIEGLFDVTAMRLNCQDLKIEPFRIEIKDVLDFIRESRVIDQARIMELPDAAWRNDPAMCVVYRRGDEVEHMLIDGVHRILRRHKEGFTQFYCWFVEERDIVRPNLEDWQRGVERGIDWGDVIVDGKIVKRGTE